MSGLKKNKKQKKKVSSSDQKNDNGGFLDFLNKDIELLGGGITDKKKERYYNELNALLKYLKKNLSA